MPVLGNPLSFNLTNFYHKQFKYILMCFSHFTKSFNTRLKAVLQICSVSLSAPLDGLNAGNDFPHGNNTENIHSFHQWLIRCDHFLLLSWKAETVRLDSGNITALLHFPQQSHCCLEQISSTDLEPRAKLLNINLTEHTPLQLCPAFTNEHLSAAPNAVTQRKKTDVISGLAVGHRERAGV